MKVKATKRAEHMIEINKELCQELSMKRKRKLAEESEDEEEVTNGNTSKRARIEAGVDQVVKNLKTKDVAELGRGIFGYQLFKLSQR